MDKNFNKNLNTGIIMLRVILFITVFLIMSKLFIVSIVHYDGFSDSAYFQTSISTKLDLPRGEIYDRNGKLIVGNSSQNDLYYIESGLMDEKELSLVATKIAETIEIEDFSLIDNEIIDLWLTYEENYETTVASLSKEEYEKFKQYSENEDYTSQNNLLRSKISDQALKEMNQLFSKEALYVRCKMEFATTKTPALIDSDLTIDEQYAIESVSNQIGGFFLKDTYKRTYPYDETLSGFLGEVGPIPQEEVDFYTSRGYDMSSSVGISYAEEALEPVLHSTPGEMQFYFDEAGNIINKEVISKGIAGHDVTMTIDIELQKEVDNRIKENLNINPYTYSTNLCASGVDPSNGELLFSSGQSEVGSNKFYDNSTCSFMDTSVLGSIVKPAALLMLYELDVREMGDVIVDEPIHIKGTQPKASYMNMGPINDQVALKLSSNVYFYKSFMELANANYVPYGPIDIDPKYFDVVRKYYSLFGLGTSTGIEMEEEELGFKGATANPGLFLDMANGQYDTNTNLQATQYVSTIANGGSRYKIQYVKSVHKSGDIGSAGDIIYQPTPVVLNELPMSDEEIDHVIGGMELAAGPGGTISDLLQLEYEHNISAAGKSGTAETYYNKDVKLDTTSALSFAPVEDPEIAISVLWPYSESDVELGIYDSPRVAQDIMDAYYDLKEK